MIDKDFEQMVVQYQSYVYTVCCNLVKNHHTAQDLTQETFLAAWLHLQECYPGSEKAWLGRIAANKAKDFLRSAAHCREAPCAEILPAQKPVCGNASAPTPQQLLQSREACEAVARQAGSLKPIYSEVALMHLFGGWALADIARELGRPRRTVQTQFHRAKLRLQACADVRQALSA